jgi:MarR family transcriptional regulator, organic hydroperoxide resistance regulator
VPHEYDPEALLEAEADIRQRLEGQAVDIEVQHAVSNLYRAAAVMSRTAERELFNEEDLSWSGFAVLWVLWIWDDMDSSRLAAELGLTLGTLTGVRKGLEAQGLVEVKRDPGDGRRRVVSLTALGRTTIERVYPKFNGWATDMLGDLSREELTVLSKLLHHIIVRPTVGGRT